MSRTAIAVLLAAVLLAGPACHALAAAPAPAKPPKPATGQDIVNTALKYKGVPYKYGGVTPKGFDCSGFVWYVYHQHGKNLPRTADKQYAKGTPVKPRDLRPGDVVFFTTAEKGASHCGIFTGNGKFIHASSSRGVMISALAETYWKPRYLGARRML